MPFVKLQTNIELDETLRKQLLKQVSSLTASQLNKPENYVMVVIEESCSMLFAGTTEPLCYVELKSISLPENKTSTISGALCELIKTTVGINPDRVYIEFADAQRSMWGWNSATF